MKMYDSSGTTRTLRVMVDEKVRSVLTGSVHSFAEKTYSLLGCPSPVTAAAFLRSVRTRKAFGCTTEYSKNFKYTPLELERLARLFRVLDIEENDPIINELKAREPLFGEYYTEFKGLDASAFKERQREEKEYRKFRELLGRLDSECVQQIEVYVRDLQKNMMVLKLTKE